MSDPGEPTAHPGKDEEGRYVTNDATAEQFAVGVVAFLRDVCADVYRRSSPDVHAVLEERLGWLQACAELVEAGTRPGGKDG